MLRTTDETQYQLALATRPRFGSQPFVRGFSGFWTKSIRNMVNHPGGSFNSFHFFKFGHAQILRKYSRRSCGSFWSGLEPRKPTIDRCRYFCSFICWFLLPPKVWKSDFSFIFESFFKAQALKPCSDCISRDLLKKKKNNSSVRPNLTDLVSKQGRDFHRSR